MSGGRVPIDWMDRAIRCGAQLDRMLQERDAERAAWEKEREEQQEANRTVTCAMIDLERERDSALARVKELEERWKVVPLMELEALRAVADAAEAALAVNKPSIDEWEWTTGQKHEERPEVTALKVALSNLREGGK